MIKSKLILLAMSVAFIACREQPKDFSTVTIGMTKAEVTTAVGEPAKKNELSIADVWVYPDADRSVIFRKDTVYNIITSAEARMDSIEMDLKNTGNTIENKLDQVGDSLQKAGEQIGDKFRRDTTKN